ncbi:MAG: alpha-amylase [Chloroflexi bacterium]|nr:alpha-amylase [Chloroflexota bacterium]MCC6893664.1 alpha-amylase [Anaerolineae bacterium]
MAKRKPKNAVGTGIPFELFAPYNESVSLIGNWDDWQPIPMQKDEKGMWHVEVPLADGEYQYKFEVISKSPFMLDQKVTVSDPKAMHYTLDSHENSTVRIRGGQRTVSTYQWKHDDVPLPQNQQLVIYEMHVGDFRGGMGDSQTKPGTFQNVIEKLDYLAELGINAIELMPVNEWPGHHSWGYSLDSIYAVENSYGTPEDLCQLVDEAHARGIRIIHDAVYNHMNSEAPLTQIDYNYWFYENNPDEGSLNFGPKFNYEHFDENLDIWPAREYVINALRLWVEKFHIDGIRFDCTRAIKYFDLLEWFNKEAHSRADFKPFYTIAEHIPQDSAIATPNGPVDAAWHDNFFRQMSATALGIRHHGREPYNTTEVLRLLDSRKDGFVSGYNTIHYLTNHDEERLMYLLGAAANTFDDAAFRRAKLGASLLLTAPGIPMVWMGEEFGQPTPKTLDPQPLQWGLLDNDRNKGLFDHYAHLIELRKENPALYSDNFEPILDLPGRGIIGFKRWNDAGDVVVVIANLTPVYMGEVELSNVGLEDGMWHEMVYDYDTLIINGILKDTLAESEVKIYIKRG